MPRYSTAMGRRRHSSSGKGGTPSKRPLPNMKSCEMKALWNEMKWICVKVKSTFEVFFEVTGLHFMFVVVASLLLHVTRTSYQLALSFSPATSNHIHFIFTCTLHFYTFAMIHFRFMQNASYRFRFVSFGFICASCCFILALWCFMFVVSLHFIPLCFSMFQCFIFMYVASCCFSFV